VACSGEVVWFDNEKIPRREAIPQLYLDEQHRIFHHVLHHFFRLLRQRGKSGVALFPAFCARAFLQRARISASSHRAPSISKRSQQIKRARLAATATRACAYSSGDHFRLCGVLLRYFHTHRALARCAGSIRSGGTRAAPSPDARDLVLRAVRCSPPPPLVFSFSYLSPYAGSAMNI